MYEGERSTCQADMLVTVPYRGAQVPFKKKLENVGRLRWTEDYIKAGLREDELFLFGEFRNGQSFEELNCKSAQEPLCDRIQRYKSIDESRYFWNFLNEVKAPVGQTSIIKQSELPRLSHSPSVPLRNQTNKQHRKKAITSQSPVESSTKDSNVEKVEKLPSIFYLDPPVFRCVDFKQQIVASKRLHDFGVKIDNVCAQLPLVIRWCLGKLDSSATTDKVVRKDAVSRFKPLKAFDIIYPNPSDEVLEKIKEVQKERQLEVLKTTSTAKEITSVTVSYQQREATKIAGGRYVIR